MAYLLSDQDDQTDQQRNGAQLFSMNAPQPGSGNTGGAVGGNLSGGAPSPASGVSGTGASGGGQYVNYTNYLNANKGAATSSAQNLAGAVGGEAKQAQGDLSTTEQQFNQGMKSGSPFGGGFGDFQPGQGFPPGAETGISTPRAAPSASSGQFQPASQTPAARPQYQLPNQADPSSALAGMNPGDAANEAQQRSYWGYTGPSDLAGTNNFAKTQADTSNAAADLAATGNAAGMQGLTQKFTGENTGDSAFDSALMGSAGAPSFSTLRNQYSGLQAALDAANQTAQGQAANAQQYATNAAAAYGAAVPGLEAQNQQQQDLKSFLGNVQNTDWSKVFNQDYYNNTKQEFWSSPLPKSKPSGWSDAEWNAYNSADAYIYKLDTGGHMDYHPSQSHMNPDVFNSWWQQQTGGKA